MSFVRKALAWSLFPFSLPLEAAAQYKAMPGISMEAGAKLYPVKYYNQLATFQPSLSLRLEHQNPKALGLWVRLGILWDPSLYKLQSESTWASKFYVSFMHRSLSFESLIMFPMRNEQLRLLAGIGMDYKMSVTTAYRVTSSMGIATYQPGGQIDSMQHLANAYLRPLIPSASIGLQYEINWVRRVRLYCLLRQNLLDAFEEDIPAYTMSTGKSGQAPTNYQPLYLRLGISCDFARDKPEY